MDAGIIVAGDIIAGVIIMAGAIIVDATTIVAGGIIAGGITTAGVITTVTGIIAEPDNGVPLSRTHIPKLRARPLGGLFSLSAPVSG